MLFRHNVKVCKTPVGHHLAEGNSPRTIKRRVDNRECQIQFLAAVNCDRLNLVKVHAVIFRAENRDHPILLQGFDIPAAHTVKIIHLLDFRHHAVRHIGADLAAVLPVGLVTVVLLRIVGGRDVDARDRPKLPDQVGQLRGRSEIRKCIDPDPSLCEDASCQLGEFL